MTWLQHFWQHITTHILLIVVGGFFLAITGLTPEEWIRFAINQLQHVSTDGIRIFIGLLGVIFIFIALVPTVTRRRIRITSPRPQEPLTDSQPFGSNFQYEVRGKLRRPPRGHKIWLLVENPTTGKVWPQGFFRVNHNETTGDWYGRVNGTKGRSNRVIAVVAPPTSQDYFEYFEKIGKQNRENRQRQNRQANHDYEPLDRVPPECKNIASVETRFL
jgi:hypothetical protein